MRAAEGQRVDRWLWQARFFRTRTLAARLVAAGKVRLTDAAGKTRRLAKPAHNVTAGDVLTFPQGRAIRVVRIAALAEQRGPASAALLLYEDLLPPEPPVRRTTAEPPAPRRPDKKARRALLKLKGRE